MHKQNRNLVYLILGLSATLSLLTFAVPLPAGVENPVAVHWRAAVSTMIFAVYLGSAIPLLLALRSFKRELRVAYGLVAWGIITFSATFIQLIIWGLLDMWDSEWAASGSGILPWILTSLLIYLGARKFAHLMNVKSLFRSFWFATGMTVVVGVAMGALATVGVQYELEAVEIYIAACSVCASYLLCAGYLMYKVYKAIGTHYKNAIRWMSFGLLGIGVAAVHEAVNTFWFNNGDTYTDYGYYLLPLLVAGLLLLRASYEFWNLPAPVPAVVPGEKGKDVKPTDADYIDSIIAVAGLASQPHAIDKPLNTLRRITAAVGPNAPLSEPDKTQLLEVYYQIEEHLTKHDALRSFDAYDIRCYTTANFQYMLAARSKH